MGRAASPMLEFPPTGFESADKTFWVNSGRTSPMGGGSQLSGRQVNQGDAAAAGGPRRPLIRSRTPANTSRGSAASAIWKTA